MGKFASDRVERRSGGGRCHPPPRPRPEGNDHQHSLHWHMPAYIFPLLAASTDSEALYDGPVSSTPAADELFPAIETVFSDSGRRAAVRLLHLPEPPTSQGVRTAWKHLVRFLPTHSKVHLGRRRVSPRTGCRQAYDWTSTL